MRVLVLAFLVACSSKPTSVAEPKPANDTAARIRVAYAEARRGGGVVELVELAHRGAKSERLLALRGLGRIGGTTALDTLRGALSDPDRDIVAGAAAGIGLLASLDDEAPNVTAALLAKADQPAVLEALGRAGDATAQPALAKLVATMPDAALALGRHGRRKIALSDEARAALVAALASKDTAIRYAATYALAREHIEKAADPKAPPPAHFATTAAALAKLVVDVEPEIRATAISGIARHKQVATYAAAIEAKLIDADWRVAIEAVRALAGDEYRKALVTAAVRTGFRQHVTNEVLRSLIGKTIEPDLRSAVDQAAANLSGDAFPSSNDVFAVWRMVLGIQRENTFRVGTTTPFTAADVGVVISSVNDHPRRHILLGLVAEWCKSKAPIDQRRVAITKLLADNDVRVRAAAFGVLPAMWDDGDQTDRERMRDWIAAAIASKDPILSGSAIEAADELYVHEETQGAISSAIIVRADNEKDVELATSLLGVIGKHKIGAGALACKQNLGGHPVLAKAAVECLKQLGEATAPATEPKEAKPPFVPVTEVIGRRILWHLKTTKGDFVIELRPDVAPWAVATIVMLTRRGYYDGLEFHRVVPNFVVQGGDPTESGWGGPGFVIPAEPGSVLDGHGFIEGGVGIADAGRDSGGSQWFVMHSRAAHLDGRYTWIGNLATGGNSANQLVVGDEVSKATIEILTP